MTRPSGKVQFIAPDAYPQMVPARDATRVLRTLHSARVAARAAAAMDGAMPPMRAAILRYADELEAARGEARAVYACAHDIRGFAQTAGLATAGRIADSLCRYLDEMAGGGAQADGAVVALHVSAIIHAARAANDDLAMGEAVAAELSALVARRSAGAAVTKR